MTTGSELQDVYRLIQDGRREDAANRLSVMLASDPDNADALWLLALSAPDITLVRHALVRLLDLRPDDFRARQMLDSLNVREHMRRSRITSQEMRPVQHTAVPAAPLPTPLRPRVARPARRPFSLYPLALAGAALFGLAGCLLLVIAALAGLRLVGDAVYSFSPSLPSLAGLGSQPDYPDLGRVNALENISYQQFRRGALARRGDRHAYRFSGGEGDFVVVELVALDAGLDPAVAIYGPDGWLVDGSADNSPEDRNARLALALPSAGDYTILVSAQSGTGGYQLTLHH